MQPEVSTVAAWGSYSCRLGLRGGGALVTAVMRRAEHPEHLVRVGVGVRVRVRVRVREGIGLRLGLGLGLGLKVRAKVRVRIMVPGAPRATARRLA